MINHKERNNMTGEINLHVMDLLPAYVLDTLSDDETCQVAEHLASCAACQAEFTRLQQVADELPLALRQVAPHPRVKVSLMKAIHARKPHSTLSSQQVSGQKLFSFWRAWRPVFAMAVILVLIVSNVWLWRQLNEVSGQSGIAFQVLTLANTEYSPHAVGELIMDPKGESGTLLVHNLSELGTTHQYQVWLIRNGKHVSAGVFSVDLQGYAQFLIQASDPLGTYDSIGISVEPYGGSPGPTGTNVLGGTLQH
jgi:anti-sigma-K factor RskA